MVRSPYALPKKSKMSGACNQVESWYLFLKSIVIVRTRLESIVYQHLKSFHLIKTFLSKEKNSRLISINKSFHFLSISL
jgi:hypothetical protein